MDPLVQVASISNHAYTSASVQIATGYAPGEDVLALSGFSGVTADFDADTATLTLTADSARTAAQVQALLRAVTYQNLQSPQATLAGRGVVFGAGGAVPAPKVVRPDWAVDADVRARIADAFGVIQSVGQAVSGLTGTPGLNDTTPLPFTTATVTELGAVVGGAPVIPRSVGC